MVTDSNVTPDICDRLHLSKKEFLEYATSENLKAIQTGAMNSEEFWHQFAENSGMTIDSDYFYDYFKPKRRTEMYEVINQIKAKGFRVVLGTNTIDSHYRKHLDNGDYNIFEKVYPSNLIGYSKPDPEFLRYILNEEGIEAENTVFVDDNTENIKSAKDIGIHAIQFDTFEKVQREINELIK